MRRPPSDPANEEDDESSKITRSPSPSPPEKTVCDSSSTLRVPREETRSTARQTSGNSVRRGSPAAKLSWNGAKADSPGKEKASPHNLFKDLSPGRISELEHRKRARWRNPWSITILTLLTTVVAVALLGMIAQSFLERQLDPKGCAMSYMRPSFKHFTGFDTEHTPFASKYSLHLYREGVIDEDPKLKGVPVLFIPGNAGSYKQARSLGSEAAYYWHDHLRHDENALTLGKRPIDFFSVDFNEDITAFHGQTLLDQATYMNDAVLYILSLYHDSSQTNRDHGLPDPTSVIVIGHSMGGIVARTMLTMPNYQPNSINTILTLSAPHARAPVSFDGDIVRIYDQINDYWRHSYSQIASEENPLSQVTLISIAGGGLDTIVPSDYASIASLVPDTHGFTVFTTSMPDVWTGMDHLAITWCNQLRKSIIRAIYDVVDVNSGAQTRDRAKRMTVFKRWFLTGLEDIAERSLRNHDANVLLPLDDTSTGILAQGERLNLRSLGSTGKTSAHIMPIPSQGGSEKHRFTLLTDQKLASTETIDVMFCSVSPSHSAESASDFSTTVDLSGNKSGSTSLACRSAASDALHLPASTHESVFPFDERDPFSFLYYESEQLIEHQFVAVIDKSVKQGYGWVTAEFSSASQSTINAQSSLQDLALEGLSVSLPLSQPLLTEIKVPALQSSLLAYKLSLSRDSCRQGSEAFAPFIRQYVTDVHESKFFVNVRQADVNVHGVAPYMPPALSGKGHSEGLSFQVWSDPTCERTMTMTLEVDMLGSLGKLWMRYRLIFAAFPLIIVSLVLRKQFKLYDETGIFMSFSEALNQCLKTSLPVLILALTFFSTSLARASNLPEHINPTWLPRSLHARMIHPTVDYAVNDLLLGFQDSFFWFLVPLFGLLSTGICVGLNFTILLLTHIFSFLYGSISKFRRRPDAQRILPTSFAVASTRRRALTTSVLVIMVSTVIPYHFAYVVLCLVQIATCTRAYRMAQETRSEANYNFYNYTHSILLFLLWILPINIPVLVVWVRNLTI